MRKSVHHVDADEANGRIFGDEDDCRYLQVVLGVIILEGTNAHRLECLVRLHLDLSELSKLVRSRLTD